MHAIFFILFIYPLVLLCIRLQLVYFIFLCLVLFSLENFCREQFLVVFSGFPTRKRAKEEEKKFFSVVCLLFCLSVFFYSKSSALNALFLMLFSFYLVDYRRLKQKQQQQNLFSQSRFEFFNMNELYVGDLRRENFSTELSFFFLLSHPCAPNSLENNFSSSLLKSQSDDSCSDAQSA